MTEAFATVARDLPWLRALAMRLAHGDADAADDLTQDTLDAAWRHPPPETTTSRSWLATVLYNRRRMTRRADGRRFARERQAHVMAEVPEPGDELARIELLGVMMTRVQALAELDQRILMLRFFDDLDATEIGALLAMPPPTVRSRLLRALARLRRELDAHHGGDHAAWAVLLNLPGSSGPLTPSLIGTIAAMTTTAKFGIAAAAATVALVAWLAARKDSQARAAPERAIASPVERVAASDTGAARAPVDDWNARRAVVRRRIGPRPNIAMPNAGAADDALVEAARQALHQVFEDCTEEQRMVGRMTLRATIIGSEDVGTVFESIESVGGEAVDKEVLECVIESTYAYVGAAPADAIDSTTTVTWLGAPPPDVDDATWRQEMFAGVIMAHLSDVRACEAGEAQGEIELAFEFGDEPSPTAVRATGHGLDDATQACVIAAARTWMFPRMFEGRTMTHAIGFPIDPGVDGPDRAEDP